MNDRAISVLENYDIKVLRTWKGRGTILFETNQGIKVLKEYMGPREKLPLIQEVLVKLREEGQFNVDYIMKNKEEQYYSLDRDQVAYIVKDFYDGRECNVKEPFECKQVAMLLAKMHKVMLLPSEQNIPDLAMQEFEKHNRELTKIKKYVRSKSQKTDFELYLLKHYDLFLEKANHVTEAIKKEQLSKIYEDVLNRGTFCHGEFQHHNVIFQKESISVINFEKCMLDSQIRDLYYFLRKIMEKNNWSEEIGYDILEAYTTEKMLTQEEKKQLYYRFLYPDKFWKIVNFYFNTRKAWIPGRNLEKLEKLLKQEEAKNNFLDKFLRT